MSTKSDKPTATEGRAMVTDGYAPCWGITEYATIAIARIIEPFQKRAYAWLTDCLGSKAVANRKERNLRFLEESLDLVRSLGLTEDEVRELVGYSFNRPCAHPSYQIGCVAIEFAALCEFNKYDMTSVGEAELVRRTKFGLIAHQDR